jgi:hypothetical protein
LLVRKLRVAHCVPNAFCPLGAPSAARCRGSSLFKIAQVAADRAD